MGTCFGCFPDDLPVHHGTYGSVEGNARAPEKQGVLVVMRHSVRLDAALVAATWSDQEQRPYDSPISDWELPVAACSLLRVVDWGRSIQSWCRRFDVAYRLRVCVPPRSADRGRCGLTAA